MAKSGDCLLQGNYGTMFSVMKKLYHLFSIILAVTILAGVGWYFFPTDQVVSGARSFKEYADRVRGNLNNDNVSAEGVKVDDAADDSYGDTGETLSFSSSACPYRALLSVKEQGVYNQIYANARDCAGTFRLLCALSLEELNDTYVAVTCDHPEIFWLANRYEYGYAAGDKDTAVQMTLEYSALKDELRQAKARFDAAAAELLNGARAYTDAADKEKYVFDTLAQTVEYNDNAACNQTAYSALVGHSTVCAGYSRAFQYILNQLGIPCYYIFGTADGGYHAWNIVQLDGEWYGVDLTWSDQLGGPNYTYFNVTDSALSVNHTRSAMSRKLPGAGGTKYACTPVPATPGVPDPSGGTAAAAADTVDSLDEYNTLCYNQIVANGVGTYSFSMALKDEELYDQIRAAAKRKDYEAGYLDAAAAALGLDKFGYEYKIGGDLDDTTGQVTLTQRVTLTEG